MQGIVGQLAEERPDLLVITGDLVDAPVEKLMGALAPLKDLELPHGMFLVTGNHEYYAGLKEWLPAFADLGIRVLKNERVAIEREGAGFDLAGVYDREGRRYGTEFGPDLQKALQGRDPKREVVLLAHQSLVMDEAERLDVGLVLAGHNHGGQIWPWMHMVGLQQPYVSGLHRQGRTAIYVSDGTGFWGPPMRLGTRSEIAMVILQSPGT
jgi:predicted MPP superfamily phosphohydrolase